MQKCESEVMKNSKKEVRFGIWVLESEKLELLPHTSCVTLGKLLNPSEHLCPPL